MPVESDRKTGSCQMARQTAARRGSATRRDATRKGAADTVVKMFFAPAFLPFPPGVDAEINAAPTVPNSDPSRTVGSVARTMMMGWGEMHAQMLHFWSDRLAEDAKTQHLLMQCKTPQDVAEVQGEFIKTAAQHYSAEATKIIALDKEIFKSVLFLRK
jgi:hypothetical protein